MKSLTIGETAPDFQLPDQHGHTIRLYQALTQGPVILFFYPKDSSPICTQQVCTFRDYYTEFQQKGYTLLGISGDTSASHLHFAEQHQLPYPLLSDKDGEVIQQYGISKHFGLFPGRVTYIIGTNRNIQMAYRNFFNANAHLQAVLDFCKR